MTTVAFQGLPGAYSHAAARAVFPAAAYHPYPSFDDTLGAVVRGAMDYAVIPMENVIAGRVAEIQLLLLNTPLYITGEYFQPIDHCLLGVKGAQLSDIKFAHSHFQAISQCGQRLPMLGIEPVATANTAMAAMEVAKRNDKTHGALSSALAAELYGLDILMRDFADQPNNVTRFIVLAREPETHSAHEPNLMTSFIFRVRNIPAALFKALGGFATNGVNLMKLESYIQDGSFVAADFYAEIDGHPDAPYAQLAFEEMKFFTQSHRILGTYAKHAHRIS